MLKILLLLLIGCGPIPVTLANVVCEKTKTCKMITDSEEMLCLACVDIFENNNNALINLVGSESIIKDINKDTCGQASKSVQSFGLLKQCPDLKIKLTE